MPTQTSAGERNRLDRLPCRWPRSAAGYGACTHGRGLLEHALTEALAVAPRRDVQVPDWLNQLALPSAVALSAADLRGVEVSMDHQCIVWCNQVVEHVAATVLQLADSPGSEHAAAHRSGVLQQRFQAVTAASSPKPPRSVSRWRQAAALWAVVNVPRLPALCAAAVAAAAYQAREHGGVRCVTVA
jgi:hypothetical protein